MHIRGTDRDLPGLYRGDAMTRYRKITPAPNWLPATFEGEPYVASVAPLVPALLIQFRGEDQVIPGNWAQAIDD